MVAATNRDATDESLDGQTKAIMQALPWPAPEGEATPPRRRWNRLEPTGTTSCGAGAAAEGKLLRGVGRESPLNGDERGQSRNLNGPATRSPYDGASRWKSGNARPLKSMGHTPKTP